MEVSPSLTQHHTNKTEQQQTLTAKNKKSDNNDNFTALIIQYII